MNAVLSDPLASPDERVVQALLARGKLKDADLARARKLQEQDGGGLLSLLGRLGLVSERDHAEACAAELGLPLVVRPSYVLGGRAMQIIRDHDQQSS